MTQLDGPTLSSLPNLQVLKVNNNLVSCLDPAIQSLSHLEVLNLQHNLLTRLPTTLADLTRLRQLRLDVNRLECGCGVEWLANLLRRKSSLGLGTDCHSPARYLTPFLSLNLSLFFSHSTSYEKTIFNPSLYMFYLCVCVNVCCM